jgi:hypothetical protein
MAATVRPAVRSPPNLRGYMAMTIRYMRDIKNSAQRKRIIRNPI